MEESLASIGRLAFSLLSHALVVQLACAVVCLVGGEPQMVT